MSVDLADRVPPSLTRTVLDLLVRHLGAPVASELSWTSPLPLLDDGVVRGASARLTRVGLDVTGSSASRYATLVEGGGDRLVVRTMSRNHLVFSSALDDHLADGLRPPIETRVGVLLNDLERGHHAEDPATNAEVATLTRAVHALAARDRSAVVSALGGVFAVPALSAHPGVALLADGGGVRSLLAALREVDSGVPLEWALRRVPGALS